MLCKHEVAGSNPVTSTNPPNLSLAWSMAVEPRQGTRRHPSKSAAPKKIDTMAAHIRNEGHCLLPFKTRDFNFLKREHLGK